MILLLPISFVEALIITEVQIQGDRADDCYIEIYNPRPEEVDIGGYAIRKRSSTGSDSSVRVIPSGTVIPGEGHFLWASSRNENFPEEVGADVRSTQYLSRNNSIAIYNKEKELVDALGWGGGEDQYKLGNIFPQNPEKEQVIKRKVVDGEYKNTKNNAEDFRIDPPPPSPSLIKERKEEKGERQEGIPLAIGSISSVILGVSIILTKRWQDTVTSRT